MPTQPVTTGQLPHRELADIAHQAASQTASDLAGQLRMLRCEPMTTPTLEPADLHHQRGRPTQRWQVPHPPPAGLMHPGCAEPAGRAALHRLAVGDLHDQLGLIITDHPHDTDAAQMQPHGHGILGNEAPS